MSTCNATHPVTEQQILAMYNDFCAMIFSTIFFGAIVGFFLFLTADTCRAQSSKARVQYAMTPHVMHSVHVTAQVQSGSPAHEHTGPSMIRGLQTFARVREWLQLDGSRCNQNAHHNGDAYTRSMCMANLFIIDAEVRNCIRGSSVERKSVEFASYLDFLHGHLVSHQLRRDHYTDDYFNFDTALYSASEYEMSMDYRRLSRCIELARVSFWDAVLLESHAYANEGQNVEGVPGEQ